MPAAHRRVKRSATPEKHPGAARRKHRKTTRPDRLTTQPAGPLRPDITRAFPLRYLIQASTLPRLASTHFFAAASGAILSTAMYLATVFWSSFVQVKFFTRS